MADDTLHESAETTPEPPPEHAADPATGLHPDPVDPDPVDPEDGLPPAEAEPADSESGEARAGEAAADNEQEDAQEDTPAAIAATLHVPPLAGTQPPAESSVDGGEWDLLLDKLRAFLASGTLQRLWQQTRSPLTALAVLVILVLLLRLYGALLGAIEGLPLVPGLLELVGLIWLLRHGAPKLVRTQERQQLISSLRQRWAAFRGQG